MARDPKTPHALSPKETLIVEALRRTARPLGAYDLIELLQEEGVSSPPTVYRALKRLTEAGLAHRIESLNAFVSCSRGGHSGTAAFAICEACGTVAEFHLEAVIARLDDWAGQERFRIDKTTIEIRGRCQRCASSATPATT